MISKVKIGLEWETLVELPKEREDSARKSYAMVTIGSGRIAIVGGWDDESRSPLKSVLVWNLRTKEWSTYEMKERRESCAAVAIEEKLYVIGGFNENDGRLSSCECLDLSVDSDTSESVSLPSMSEEMNGCAAVVYDKTKIVVLGGWNGSRNLPTVEMFDAIENVWTELPPMSTK